MKILAIYERVPHDRSFLSHRLVCDFYPFWWHCHQSYEIFTSLRGGGRYIIGNQAGEFKPMDILVAGPGVPHSFYSLESMRRGFEFKKIHFEESTVSRILAGLPEMKVLEPWFSRAKIGMVYSGNDACGLASLFNEIHMAQEKDHASAFCLFLSLLSKLQKMDVQETGKTAGYAGGSNFNVKRMDSICSFLQKGFSGKITLGEVAQHVNMSVPALCAFFKRSSNTSIIEYVNRLRIEKACSMLIDDDKSISEIAFESGYQTLSHFNSKFRRTCGMTPKEFRKEGQPYLFLE